MPLSELIRYFNAADQAGEVSLYARGERVEAWAQGFRLASRFRPIVDVRCESIVGHQAQLAVRHEDGRPATVANAFALCESEQSVVHFDRLCRTLHALNFLAQRRTVGGYLQLPVHPRHLLAVPNQHGLVYEAVLKRCGLAPDDIVLELDAPQLPPDAHFIHALSAYRERGYRLALRVPERPAEDAADWASLLALRPDRLRVAEAAGPWLAAAQEAGIALEREGIASGADWQRLRAEGIDFALGPLFGEAHVDCRPTHKASGNPTIPLSRTESRHENRQ